MNKNLIEKYLKYAQTEEAYAVLFVKKYLKKAENKWIDIISLDAGAKAEELEFTSLNCELFERKIKPKYPNRKEYLSEEEYEQACRAITWKTAHEDIEKQRLKGICGTRYYIKGKYIKNSSYFVDNAPPEIKLLEKNLNDRTNPLWDDAMNYVQKNPYRFKIKFIKRLN